MGKWFKYNTNNELDKKILSNNLKRVGIELDELNSQGNVYVYYDESNSYRMLFSTDKNNSLYNVKCLGIDDILEEEMIDIFLRKIRSMPKFDKDELTLCEKYCYNLKKIYSIYDKTIDDEELNKEEIKYVYLDKKKVEQEVEYYNLPLFDEIIDMRNIKNDYDKLDDNSKIKMVLAYGMEHPNELLTERKIINKALSINPFLFKVINKNIDDYYDIARYAIKREPINIDFVDPSYEHYVKLAITAINTNPYAIEYIDESAYKKIRNSGRIDFDTLKMDKNISVLIDEMDKIIAQNKTKSLNLNNNK